MGAVDINLEECDVSPSEKYELKTLQSEYRDVFAINEREMGHTNRTQFNINTTNNVPLYPVAVKLRRTPLFGFLSPVCMLVVSTQLGCRAGPLQLLLHESGPAHLPG